MALGRLIGVVERSLGLARGSVEGVLKNAAYILAGNIVSVGISFAVSIYIANVLGVADYGTLGTLLAILTFFTLLTDPGVNYTTIRECSRNESLTAEYCGKALRLRMVFGLSAVAGCMVLALLMPYAGTTRLLLIMLSTTLVPNVVTGTISAVFQIHRRMEFLALTQVSERVMYAVSAVILVNLGAGLTGVIAGNIIGAVGSLLVTWWASVGVEPLNVSYRPDWRYIRRVMSPALLFFLASMLGNIYTRIDVVMLSMFVTSGEVGAFVAANSFNLMLLMGSSALATAAFPAYTAKIFRGEVSLRMMLRFTMILMALACTAAVMLFLLSDHLVRFLFRSPGFESSPAILRTLAPIFIVALSSIPVSLALDALNLQKVNILNALMMSVANISLNLYLIPRWGAQGAAVGTTLSWYIGFIVGMPIGIYFLRGGLRRVVRPLPGSASDTPGRPPRV